MNDLTLIDKNVFDDFTKKRDDIIKREERIKNKIELEKNKVEKEIKISQKASLKNERHMKVLENERIKEEHDKMLLLIRNKTHEESVREEIERGKVPIRVDSRTVVYVKRERCVLLKNGTYELKEGDKLKTQPIGNNKAKYETNDL